MTVISAGFALRAPAGSNSSDPRISDECDSDSDSYRTNSESTRRFCPVQVRMLRTTKTDATDLFVQYEPQAEPVLYCRAGSRPDNKQFAELAEIGMENLYVRSDDFCNLSNDVLTSLDLLLKQRDIQRTEKFAALQIAVAVTVEQTLRLVDCSKFQALASKVGDDLVGLFGDGDVLPRELFRMARHD